MSSMRIAQSETAIAQYHAMRDSGELAPLQRQIIAAMTPGRIYSRRELSSMCLLETSCVAGRTRELLDMGRIEVVGTILCPLTRRNVEGVKLAETQLDIFAR